METIENTKTECPKIYTAWDLWNTPTRKLYIEEWAESQRFLNQFEGSY